MSYCEYDDDPNYDLFYYDEYPEPELVSDQPPQEYCLKRRRKRRVETPVTRSLDGNITDDTDDDIVTEYIEYQPRRYVVPVMYAPLMADPKKNEMVDDIYVHENIDIYYNDSNNLEREADHFYNSSRPYYYASTIQEETESSRASFIPEPGIVKGDFNKDGSKIVTRGGKMHKIKKKHKYPQHSEPICFKKIGRKEKNKKNDEFPEKLEVSNSWTTLKSSHYGTTNECFKKVEITNDAPKTMSSNDLAIKKSKSLVTFTEQPIDNVKFDVNVSIENTNDGSKSQLQAVRDTDDVPNDIEMNKIRENYKNPKNKSKDFKVKTRTIQDSMTESTDVISWKNKSLADSTATESSKTSYEDTPKSNVPNVPISSDTTNITINTVEYKQFLNSIETPLRAEIESTSHYRNSQPSDSQNSVSIDDGTQNSILVNVGESSETFLERIIKAKQAAEERKRLSKRKINPLMEVPLSLSNNAMYFPTFLAGGYPIIVSKDEKHVGVIAKKGSFFLKIIRLITGSIGSVQNFVYRYFLRYILFV